MYNEKKEITLNVTIEYQFNGDLEKIKDLIKEIIALDGVKQLEIENKN